MIHATDIREKLLVFKDGVKNLFNKFSHRIESAEEIGASKRSGVYEFGPEDSVGTSPITGRPLSGDGSGLPQKLVWENEEASMQDKSYSFDEATTDADYEFEDDFEFEDEDDVSRGRESRYN